MMQGQTLQYALLPQDVQQKDIRVQDEGHRNSRRDILRYAGGNVHDGDGALHPFLSGGGESRPTFFR